MESQVSREGERETYQMNLKMVMKRNWGILKATQASSGDPNNFVRNLVRCSVRKI